MNMTQRLAVLVACVVLVVTAAVYFITLTPTVPFWDSGEFIAVSYILGIPHPPGTPLFVLIGRIATLIPWGNVAQRVNAVSAVSGVLCVLLTYLTIVRLIRLVHGPERKPWHEWVAVAGAFTGSLMLAFSDAFWENSIEAEVYQLMSLAQILVFWLGLKWWEAHDRKPTVGPLLLATYVMWLCVGLHLGVGIMGLPLIVLVFLVDRSVALLFLMPFLSLLAVTMGLERMAGAVMLLATGTFCVYAMRGKLNGWIAGGGALLALYGARIAFGDQDFSTTNAIVAALGILVPLVALALRSREGKVLALALFLMIAGYSTHIYLPIRAAQHPAVNEGAPATWDRLRYLLERKQYGEMNMFERRAPLAAQLDKEFWRYFRRQWPIFPTDRLWGALLPLLLGIAGGVWQWRERKSFLMTFTFLGLSTGGMILFLNFTDHEVRDRDYFFQSGYHAYTLWIGLGTAWLLQWVRESFAPGRTQRIATIATGVLLASQPLLLMKNMWYTHDRRGNYVARDYAYNMLAPLAPNSFVFTNGDNDTFPLWYIQQVEGVRKDVRVVNLSLLNTDWYIRQLRDEEPKVPITFDDRIVEQLGPGAVMDSTGRIIYTNEIMVHHILDNTRKGDGWTKQPYFAVTVPEHYGYDPFFQLKGLVYEVKRDSTQGGLDVDATRKALYETFQYRGLFMPDGSWDKRVYKDENASTLSRNYEAAHLQLAFHYRRTGDMKRAVEEMERVGRMFPNHADALVPLAAFYMEQGDTTRAIELIDRLVRSNPNNPEVRYYYAMTLAIRGRIEDAIREFEAAIRLDPDYGSPYYGAYMTLWDHGERERAMAYLQRWLDGHAGDTQAAQLLESARRSLGQTAPAPSPGLGRPPLPTLP